MKLLRINNKSIILLLISLVISGGELFSQTTFRAHENSRLWIEGRSNVNTFECMAQEYIAEAILPAVSSPEFVDPELPDLNIQDNVTITVGIKVDGFECGRSRMNRDLKEALNSAEFPEITFILKNASALSIPENPDDGFDIEVEGSLRVAGVTRDIKFQSKGYYMNDGRIRAIGSKSIKMSDFNVEPPTALLGMVKAEDELNVRFDLIGIEN